MRGIYFLRRNKKEENEGQEMRRAGEVKCRSIKGRCWKGRRLRGRGGMLELVDLKDL